MNFLSTTKGNSRWHKGAIAGFLFILLFILGTLQNGYVVNLFDGSRPLLISRHSDDTFQFYPLDSADFIESILLDPRWISFMLYTSGFFLLTLIIIYFLFKEIKYLKYVLIVFGFLISLSFMLSILSFITGSYEAGYQLAQNVKGIYQSPLITFFLITFIYFLNQQKKV